MGTPERHFQPGGVSFTPPNGWADRTIVAFSGPGPAENAPSIVMTHEPLREKETLRTHADRQLAELSRQLREFRLLEKTDTALGDLPAIRFRFDWVSQSGALEQSITLVERAVPAGRIVLTFTCTASRGAADEMRSLVSEFMRSVR